MFGGGADVLATTIEPTVTCPISLTFVAPTAGGDRRSIHALLVDVMTADVVTVTPETRVRDIARLMIAHRISGIPVVDPVRHLAGIVTDGDLYRRVEIATDRKHRSWLEVFGFDAGEARDYVASHAHTAGDVMTTRVFAVTTRVFAVTPQTSIQQIARLFERERIRRAPVVADGVVVGIVSRANLVQALASISTEDAQVNLADRRVRDLVIAEYRRLPWGTPSESNVIVTDGVVHLWGYVPSDAELDALRVAVEGILGIKGFDDHTFRFLGDTGHRQQRPSQVIVEEPGHMTTTGRSPCGSPARLDAELAFEREMAT